MNINLNPNININEIVGYFKKNLLSIMPYFIVVILLFVLVFYPVYNYGKKMKKRIKVDRELLAEYLILTKNQDLVMAKYSTYKRFVEINENSENRSAFLYGIIEKLSKKNNLTIGDLRPRIESNELIAFDLELTGELDLILELLLELERKYPFIVASAFRLQSLPDRKNIQCSMILEYLE